jgi:hypothetical protein
MKFSTPVLVAASTALVIACNGGPTRPGAAPAETAPIGHASPTRGAVQGHLDLGKVGDSHFATSCDREVQPDFDDAVALLHSFFYEEARRRFAAIATRDPGCAMAHWGIAMTLYHPVWAGPTPAELEEGAAATERAKSLGAKTAREQGYIHAIEAFYGRADQRAAGPTSESCHGPVGGEHRARALAYERAMQALSATYADDAEAAIFYALALLGTASPTDKTYENQLRAAAMLEKLYPAHANHPGIAHYLIHSYDYPELAARALPHAKAYAGIAPQVPHALHMPSHIFTRLGMWRESIASNRSSAEAARRYGAELHPGATYFDELHALDYLEYAYLQTADDRSAKAVVDQIATVEKTYPEIDMAAAYAFGAIPARYALERRQWADAATLTVRPTPFWAAFPFAEANLELAHALGAARSGDVEGARKATARLEALGEAIRDPKFQFFAKQVEMQTMAASAWLARAQAKNDEAERLLRRAAELEDTLGKHPVTPGAIVPVRELLGDLLLELKQPARALTEYEASLRLYPGRFAPLYGAGHAAELAGQGDAARKYFGELIALAKGGDGARAELAHARAFMGAPAK